MAKNFGLTNRTNRRNALAQTSQMQKARKDQVENNAGGFVFQTDLMNRIRRFLVLGSTAGSYYVSGNKEMKNSLETLNQGFNTYGTDVIDEIVAISEEGRAPKNDAAIFALAFAASHENSEVRAYALSSLSKVCRIATHLFTFLTYVSEMRGFGRGLKNAVAKWYNDMEANKLAYQVCKYGSRRVEGELPWSHRDALRVGHPIAANDKHNIIYRYLTKGDVNIASFKNETDLKYIYWHEKCMNATTVSEAIEAIEGGNLSFESVPKELLNNKQVYDVLVQKMPYTATLRNLGKMTEIGTLMPLGSNTKIVTDRLTDDETIKNSRVHPMSILLASKVYGSGHGFKGSLSWNPIPQIKDSLDTAFYKAFKNVTPTGKNILIGVDVSGSMSWSTAGNEAIMCHEAAAALALFIAKTEQNYYIHGFSDRFVDLGITAKDTLESATRKTQRSNFGSTDCALPMIYAMGKKLDVDAFVVITDNETWAGSVQPFEALKSYRHKMHKPEAKLIVLAMTNTEFTIADPSDMGMLDLSGLDSSVPVIMNDFIMGKI